MMARSSSRQFATMSPTKTTAAKMTTFCTMLAIAFVTIFMATIAPAAEAAASSVSKRYTPFLVEEEGSRRLNRPAGKLLLWLFSFRLSYLQRRAFAT